MRAVPAVLWHLSTVKLTPVNELRAEIISSRGEEPYHGDWPQCSMLYSLVGSTSLSLWSRYSLARDATGWIDGARLERAWHAGCSVDKMAMKTACQSVHSKGRGTVYHEVSCVRVFSCPHDRPSCLSVTGHQFLLQTYSRLKPRLHHATSCSFGQHVAIFKVENPRRRNWALVWTHRS